MKTTTKEKCSSHHIILDRKAHDVHVIVSSKWLRLTLVKVLSAMFLHYKVMIFPFPYPIPCILNGVDIAPKGIILTMTCGLSKRSSTKQDLIP